MDELLQQLESKLKLFLRRHDQLKRMTQDMHPGTYHSQREQLTLLAKHKIAMAQIEKIVSHLKLY